MSEFNGILGVSKVDDAYQIAVWAPNAKSVSVVGEFNDWDESRDVLKAAENGVWYGIVGNVVNGASYQFCITTADGNTIRKNDPRARKMTNSAGHSIVYDDDFNWKQKQFDLPPVHQRVIYELHIGTFNKPNDGHGTFASAIEKLPELVDLGVNMIEIMPVNEFAGDISWGYNPAYPFAIEEAYGGPDGLKQFIDSAHQLGLAVILDVVYNHFGPSDLDIWQFDGWSENDKGGIYFYNDHRSTTPWGDTRPDYGRIEVRDYIKDNALMWLDEFNADGLRMDMIPFMRSVSGTDDGQDDIPEAYNLLKDINSAISDLHPNKMSIAEDLHRHNYITDPIAAGGCGFSAQWDAEFVHPIRKSLTETQDEHVDLDSVERAILHSYSNLPYSRVIYTESHDEVANGAARVVEEVAPGNVDDDFFARQKGILAAVMVLTSAGIPMLFQGQEFKESGWFNDNDDIDWSKKQQFKQFYSAVKALISLRKNTDGKSSGLTGSHSKIIHRDDENKVLGYKRSTGFDSESAYVYINLSNRQLDGYELTGMPTDMKCVFGWNDGLITDLSDYESSTLSLAPFMSLIFVDKK